MTTLYFTETKPNIHVQIDNDANVKRVWKQAGIADNAIVLSDIDVTFGKPRIERGTLYIDAMGLHRMTWWICDTYKRLSVDIIDTRLRGIVRTHQLHEMLRAIRADNGASCRIDESYHAARVAEQLAPHRSELADWWFVTRLAAAVTAEDERRAAGAAH